MSFVEEFESPNKDKPRLKKSLISSSSSINSNDSRRKSNEFPNQRLNIGNLEISIEKIGLKDYKRVAKTLTLSFNKDPFVNYILNTKINYTEEDGDEDEIRRLSTKKNELFQAFFEISVVEYIAYGGIVIVIKDVNFEMSGGNLSSYPFLAAACWNNMKFDNSLTLDYDDIEVVESPTTKFLLMKTNLKFNYLAYLNKCRQKSLKEKLPFIENIRNSILINLNLNLDFKNKFNSIWYLSDIGVLPSITGKSLGKILINYCVENFVTNDSWVYLESSNIINRKFYTKLGFTVANTFAINEDDVIVNNINIDNVQDLKILNGFNDFILLDAMFRPPSNITIERESYKITTSDKVAVPINNPVPISNTTIPVVKPIEPIGNSVSTSVSTHA